MTRTDSPLRTVLAEACGLAGLFVAGYVGLLIG